MMHHNRSAAVAAAIFINAVLAVNPIVAKGKYFFDSVTGAQFFIKGVAYQQGVGVGGVAVDGVEFVDQLADPAGCARDIPYLQQLGTNTIRVYAVNSTADHSQCMSALDAAGIYVIADLSEPGLSINRDDPQWTTDLYARYTSVIDNMAQFPNTLGFFAGNEVTNNNTNTPASAFVKAAVRDSKAYIASQNFDHWMGVGYATNDDAGTRDNLADYFNCGNQSDAVDFWGYNIYEWCGQSTFQSSGYEERTTAFQNYSVPAFFSEYGCNNPGGAASRIWQETATLYSSEMNQVWSGGIAYEYFEEQNDFGLVTVSTTGVTPGTDFTALAKQIKAVSNITTTTTLDSVTTDNTPRDCPAVTGEGGWAAAEALPPTPNAATCQSMVNSLSCVQSDSVTTEDIGTLFGTVCGIDPTACTGITANATSGVYGDFVMCSATQQLSYALNQYYVNQGRAASACNFNGQAKLVTPSESSSAGSSSSGTTVSGSSGSSGSSGTTSESSSSSGSGSGTSSSSSSGTTALPRCASA
ncbi:Glucanosyltransferase-domain-containing protein [Xylariales sp. PMI_506]|nr:Glucanosyltransferase-domain-containing protein [Xylariales sp. PMI_506]